MSELAIAFESYIPHPDKPGYLKFNGVKDKDDIYKQIVEVLSKIPFSDEGSAYDSAEWVGMAGKYGEDFRVPNHGEPIVFYRHGSNEGYIVEILLRDNGIFYPICSIKYLVDEDSVANLVRKLVEASQNGLYGER